MNDEGQVYQAASYRADGRGFEQLPQKSDIADLCLGSPHINQEKRSQAEWKMLQSFNARQDEAELKARAMRRYLAQRKRLREMAHDLKMQIPAFKGQLVKEAAIQSMSGADFGTNTIWGVSNGRYANGVGRTNDEVLREAAIYQSMGTVPQPAKLNEINSAVVSTDPIEIEQYYLSQQAGQKIRSDAEKMALQKEQELYQEKSLRSQLAKIDSVNDAQLVEPQSRYIEDEMEQTSENLKKVGIALGVLALINAFRG
jgi:hypothetical protein